MQSSGGATGPTGARAGIYSPVQSALVAFPARGGPDAFPIDLYGGICLHPTQGVTRHLSLFPPRFRPSCSAWFFICPETSTTPSRCRTRARSCSAARKTLPSAWNTPPCRVSTRGLSPGPEGTWVLEDLQSRNGTRLNGLRLARAQELKTGDRVIFGEIETTFRAPTAAERAADALDDDGADPAVGHTFAGRYRLRAIHGETPECVCFRAADLDGEDRTVAVRVFRPGTLETAGGYAAMAKRFEAVRGAPAHPNVAGVLDFALWRERAYLVAGWSDGYPLAAVLTRPKGVLTVREALAFARQAAAVTTYARAHLLPAPELGLSSVLVCFDTPLTRPNAWTKLLNKTVTRWPKFTLKITPRVGASDGGYPFGALLLELLGATPGTTTPGGRPAPVHVPGLGERGNKVLARGLSSRGEAFGGDAAFVALLARAADPRGRA